MLTRQRSMSRRWAIAKLRRRIRAYAAFGSASVAFKAGFETAFREREAGVLMRGSTWQPQHKAGEGIRTLDIQLGKHVPQARVTAEMPLRHHQRD